ncbi:MAG: Ltp family lipoprotein [Candidatus Gribaldobacteria bacterium]|nr:Ltp family lipoprotein [Candidatus Gribaldobacteria bacterium]
MKNKTALIVGGVIVFIIILAIIGGSGSNNNPTQITSSNDQPSLCSDIASLKNQATTVNFKELDKNPDSFKGKIAKFTGQVLQIQEADNYGVIRLAVTKESYGWSIDDIVYVEYQNHTDAVEDDVVTVYGQLTGSKTYESQAHFNITVPSMTACAVEKGTGVTQTPPTTKPTTQKTTSAGQTKTQSTQQPVTPTAPTPTPAPQTDNQNISPTSNETVSQKNAVKKAISYLGYSAFSHDGLVAQLEYEQFSHADAVYGADNSGANWNEQAAKKAKSYMEYTAFSRGSLIEQLKYENFTQEQAEYGANSVGL